MSIKSKRRREVKVNICVICIMSMSSRHFVLLISVLESKIKAFGTFELHRVEIEIYLFADKIFLGIVKVK